jgi:hypothetical protein
MDCSRTVELIALAQKLVELHFAQHAAQRGLRQLRRGVEEIGNLHDGQARLQDPEVNHRVHFHGDVVARDHVLRRHFESIDAQRNAHDAVDGREDQDDARSFGLIQQAAQAEDDAALVLAQNLDGGDQVQHHDDDDDRGEAGEVDHVEAPFSGGTVPP